MTKSSFVVLFFFINLLVIAIWMGGLKSAVQDCDSFSYLPPLFVETEYQLPEELKDEDSIVHDNDDFLPRLVLVEYKKEEPLLLVYSDDDGDGFHGYDGYEEDNDDSGGDNDDVDSEDEGVEDLKRFEEFIAKQKGNWREELLNDKLLCITAGDGFPALGRKTAKVQFVILLGDLKSYIQDYDSFYDLPPFVVLEAEHQSPQESKAKDCNIPVNKDFLPCLVLVEYKKEEPLMLVEYIKEEQEEPLMLVEYIKEEQEEPLKEPLWLECSGDDGDGFRGYDSYEEDDDDEEEEELRRRFEEKRMFEEFIAKHYRKWREELVTDKLLYITAVILLGDLKSYIQDYDSFYDLPPFVVLEAEHQSPQESKAKDCNIPDNKDFLPCLVLVEYIKEEPFVEYIKEEPLMLVEYIKEEQEEPLMLVEYIKEEQEEPLKEPLWLECSGDDGDGFRGYDSYEEDDDDEEEEELRRRFEEKRMFEEFIAKHYRKWREELVTDKLLYITAGT
ncbi:hypothetical protein RHSIM_Rhsim07G0027300 [Rhododendron simsii]|uniref:Uncharacterized protein n=1 Tax=Rhododendron simsii TaxID=118357 RepID=A0A834LJ54_RHOSS|nr:hypothetical protein RHSIM_Rhsim07G0027300 [Rhododendron simsii]